MENNSFLSGSEQEDANQTIHQISISNATENLIRLLEVPCQYRKPSHIQKIFFYIQKLQFFRKFQELEDSYQICKRLELVHFNKGKIIFRENDKGDSMYSILKGSASIFKYTHTFNATQTTKEEVHVLFPGDCFGEYCLFHETVRSVNVEAKEECKMIKLNKETFLTYPNCLQTYYQMLLFKFFSKYIPLKNVEIEKLQNIIEKCQLIKKEPNATIIRQGEQFQYFYLVLEGLIRVIILFHFFLIDLNKMKCQY